MILCSIAEIERDWAVPSRSYMVWGLTYPPPPDNQEKYKNNPYWTQKLLVSLFVSKAPIMIIEMTKDIRNMK